jgi:hypothetical protein
MTTKEQLDVLLPEQCARYQAGYTLVEVPPRLWEVGGKTVLLPHGWREVDKDGNSRVCKA